ncbi:MAG: HIRAN domain-containing protein [Candidatus Helarchaeota archaeon]
MGRYREPEYRVCPNCGAELYLEDYVDIMLDHLKERRPFYLFHQCFRCGNQYCDYCGSQCPICFKITCPCTTYHECEVCHQTMCQSCAKKCKICGVTICRRCGIKCVSCNRYLCPSHAEVCHDCEGAICNTHRMQCENCGKVICPNCTKNCDSCHITLCKSCGDKHLQQPPDPQIGRHLNAQDELERLKQITTAIHDLSIENRTELYQKAVDLLQELYSVQAIPYKCPKCNRMHNPSTRLYPLHRKYLKVQIEFGPITSCPLCKRIESEIVGAFYTGNQELLTQISQNTPLLLQPEPENPHDSKAVSVWHQETKLGYIPRAQNAEIFQAIQSSIPYCAFFDKSYQHSASASKSPVLRAKIVVLLLDTQNAIQMTHAMQELERLGYVSVWDNIKKFHLSQEELTMWKKYLENKNVSSYNKVIQKFEEFIPELQPYRIVHIDLDYLDYILNTPIDILERELDFFDEEDYFPDI